MPAVLPFVPSIPLYTVGTVLDGVTVFFRVRWAESPRVSRWYFDLLDENQLPIATGIKLLLGTYLARYAHHPLTEAGAFVARDLSGGIPAREAGFDDLGVRVVVYWFTKAEMASEITGSL